MREERVIYDHLRRESLIQELLEGSGHPEAVRVRW